MATITGSAPIITHDQLVRTAIATCVMLDTAPFIDPRELITVYPLSVLALGYDAARKEIRLVGGVRLVFSTAEGFAEWTVQGPNEGADIQLPPNDRDGKR